MLEKDGEDQLDRSCEKWRCIARSQGPKVHPTQNRMKEWNGCIFPINFLLKTLLKER